MSSCPICELQIVETPVSKTGDDAVLIRCPNCGDYKISRSAQASIADWREKHPAYVAMLSHKVWKRGDARHPPLVTATDLEEIVKQPATISVTEQADNLILELAAAAETPGQVLPMLTSHWVARVGASNPDNVRFISESLINRDLLVEVPTDSGRAYRITFPGWQYIEELRRGQHESRKAFFASKWGDPLLDQMYSDVFAPAVAQTGFRLFRLDEHPQAGLIDDRMRVEIRTSKFVIADLTHDNSGAYWEAGFAEGLGKPVIFICQDGVETHFDTNHHLTVTWDENDRVGTAERLKATIRATLPEDATLEDPPKN